jgi:hypothetical protein
VLSTLTVLKKDVHLHNLNAELITTLKTDEVLFFSKQPHLIMHGATNAITPDYIASSDGFSANRRKSTERRISFATVLSQVVGIVPSRDEFTASEKRNYWCSYQDQELSRAQVRSDIVAVRRNGPLSFENSYEKARTLAMDDGINTLLKHSNLQSSNLHAWTSNGVGRGLEIYISPYHSNQREDDSRQARTMVFFTQRKGVPAQLISEIYAESSRSSLIYSIIMGEADSMCVSRYDNDKVTVPTHPTTPLHSEILTQNDSTGLLHVM